MHRCSALALVVVLVVAGVSADTCSDRSGYRAGYDLSTARSLETPSSTKPSTTYFIQPCLPLATDCGPYKDQSVCYDHGFLQYSRLGAATSGTWTAIGGDWWNGASSFNTDVSAGVDQCTKNSDASTTVNYVCNKGTDTVSVKEPTSSSDPCVFEFTVDSSIVCQWQKTNKPGEGGSGGTASASVSGGWVFVIIFVVAAFVYLMGGMAFNRIRNGKSGLEMVPNLSFWRDLPGLVKDGCAFTFAKVRQLFTGRGGAGLSGTSSTGSYETI